MIALTTIFIVYLLSCANQYRFVRKHLLEDGERTLPTWDDFCFTVIPFANTYEVLLRWYEERKERNSQKMRKPMNKRFLQWFFMIK